MTVIAQHDPWLRVIGWGCQRLRAGIGARVIQTNPRNRRRRCSLLLEAGLARMARHKLLIDSGPDMRDQLLDAGIGRLDAVVYTHAHADHVHGLDDLRQIVFNMREKLPVWADGPTQDALLSRFGYAFTQPPNSPLPAHSGYEQHRRGLHHKTARAARLTLRPRSG